MYDEETKIRAKSEGVPPPESDLPMIAAFNAKIKAEKEKLNNEIAKAETLEDLKAVISRYGQLLVID